MQRQRERGRGREGKRERERGREGERENIAYCKQKGAFRSSYLDSHDSHRLF